jgi:hypothetical protein
MKTPSKVARTMRTPTAAIPDLDIGDFAGPAELANVLEQMGSQGRLPVWIVCGIGKSRVTQETLKGVCRGLRIASDMQNL